MSEQSFRFSLEAIAMAVILSVPTFPGAIVGGLFAFGIAFFIALPVGLAAEMLQRHGIAATLQDVLVGVLALYALMVAVIGLLAWRAWLDGNGHAGRLLAAKTALFAALPLIAYFSTNAISKTWTSL